MAHAHALWQQAQTLAPKLALALLIFAIFVLLGRAVRFMVGRIARARRDSGAAQALNLAASAADVALLFAGMITALGTIGIDVSALVAALGLTGFALGFALRDALSSLLAGCLILVYHPFRPGEKISVAGSEGTVVEINLRYTTLESEGKRILVPNSVLYTNTIAIVQN